MIQVFLYFLGGLAMLLILGQIAIALHTKKERGREMEHVKGEIGDAIRSGYRVIAYFYSASNSESRQQTPVIDKLSGEFDNIFKIDIAEGFEFARTVGIHETPTIVIIEGGEIRDLLVGLRTEEILREAFM